MKRTALTTALLLAALTAFGQTQPDTILVVRTRTDTVTVTRSAETRTTPGGRDGMTRIRRRSELDFDIPFYDRIKSKKEGSCNLSGFGVGLIGTDAPSPYSFNMSNSMEFFFQTFSSYRKGRKGRNSISLGFGIGWKNFALTGHERMDKENGKIFVGPYPENADPKVSRLSVFSFNFPLLYTCHLGDGFGFSLGPVLNLNAGSKIKTKYWLDGEKFKDKDKKVHCNTATVDFMLRMNFKHISLYAKYTPWNLMDKAYWPGFQHYSFGVIL